MSNKFSVIVPVYNTEKYLRKCLDSLVSQTLNEIEIIVVNDGSPDNSQDIIDEYAKNYPEKVRAYIKENGGLSDARNYGIERANGEYLMFVDSDDYISTELLEILNSKLCEKAVDVIRFNAQVVLANKEKGETLFFPQTSAISGIEAIDKLIDNKQYFEPAPFYAYRREYWQKNNFCFSKGRYHEDFGLIPEVIIKAQSFSSVEHIGYFYFQSDSSIMRTVNIQKDNKRAYDGLSHFDHLYSVSEGNINDKKVKDKFNSYIANSVITRINFVYGDVKKDYLEQLKKRKAFDLLLSDSVARKIKKAIIKIKYNYWR